MTSTIPMGTLLNLMKMLSMTDSLNLEISPRLLETRALLDERNSLKTLDGARAVGYVEDPYHPNRLLKAQPRLAKPLGITFCNDCEVLFPMFYMLKNDLWEQAGGKKKMFLCIPCLEIRLGRSIQLDDFSSSLVNDQIRYGFNLGNVNRKVNVIPLRGCPKTYVHLDDLPFLEADQ